MISAKVIAHSVSRGHELVTLQLRAPKFLDAEFEKHRMISSNSSSDRAIPLTKMLNREYFIPTDIRINQAGMQGVVQLSDADKEEFYVDIKNLYGATSDVLLKWNKVHKQHLNRYLLGFSYQDKVATANREWFEYFFNLRLHEAADPAMYELARCMKEALGKSTPDVLTEGEWHLPYVNIKDLHEDIIHNRLEDFDSWLDIAIRCSVARCARVSYLNHDNSTPSVEDDLELYNMLSTRPYTDKRGTFYGEGQALHLSPLEHQATPMDRCNGEHPIECETGVSHMDRLGNMWSGNFKGWIQYRKLVEGS